ncbi:SpoIID/LytB domain-containing protein [Nocardia sp. NPDC020380]|uniref:SpoIID/LytB domain-containing protein n=1 Tax=Nocardia sp. NPDC020380 TaxID=3364309 RepID=UPI0037888250
MPNGYLQGRLRRRRLIVLSVTAVTFTGGAAGLLWAWPDGAFRVTAGVGHGRGMSQNGAFDLAGQGWNVDRILANYYPGADLATIGAATIRVRLQGQDDKTLDIISESPFFVAGRRVIPGQAAHLDPTATGAKVTITQGCDGNTLWEGDTDDPWAYPTADGTDRPANEQLEICGGNAYRGDLGVALDNGAARTVNDVDIDDYLRGVVPAEMVPDWADQGGAEALKAQAIAARSYALAEKRYPYAETCDTTDCQMYPGTDKEDPRTTTAVQATTGRVLVHDNHILRTEYSAAPDGSTPTPASAMEVGPAISDFPAPRMPSLPTLPDLAPPPNPAAPTPPDPTTPPDPNAPLDPNTQLDPNASAGPAAPADPNAPLDPSAPANPPVPVDPNAPANPASPRTAPDPALAAPNSPGTVDPAAPPLPGQAPVRPNPRTRVGTPAPTPPNLTPLLNNLFRILGSRKGSPDPASPAVPVQPVPPGTVAPSTASTPTPPAEPNTRY